MAKDSEADLLARARQYSFRARMDKGEVAGPVFVSGQGSEVEDVTGKRWLDFNSGQMCAALGHNHPAVTAAIIGPRTMEHLESQLPAAGVELSDEILDRIDEIVAPGVNLHTDDAGWENPALAPSARRR